MIEHLEQRIALAADIASVGLSLDAGVWSVFAAETSFDDDDVVTSRSFDLAGAGGPIAGESALDSIERLSLGRFTSTFAGDAEGADPDLFAGFDAETGGNFFAEDGYASGFFSGLDDSAADARYELSAQRRSGIQLADLQGQWLVTMSRVNVAANRVDTLTGQGNFGGQFFVLILTGAPGVAPFVQTIEYTVPETDGKFTTLGDTARLYLNNDASVLLGVDLDTTDGDAWIFSAVRTTSTFTPDDLAGDYRLGALATSDALRAALGIDTVAPSQIELTAAGQFRLSSLFDDDRGDGPTILSGSFAIADATLTLSDAVRGVDLTFLISDNGSTLQANEVDLAGGAEGRLFGLAARVTGSLPPGDGDPQDGPIFAPDGDIILTEVRVSPTGRPEAFELDESGQWRRVDLLTRAGGDEAPSDEAATDAQFWTDPSDGADYAAVAFPSATLLYTRDDDGVWTARNLTDETTGNAIAGGLTQFLDIPGNAYIAGLDASGDLVLYRSGAVFPEGSELVFSFRNLTTQELVPRGQEVPAFTGGLISYVVSWNALTIAGLDTSGDVWGVWTGPGSNAWNSSNLSDITGAEPLVGGLTAFITSWNAINIAGLNSSGEVVVSWWVPGFGGAWRVNNLTTQFSGPALSASSITSFVAPWGALNIAGLDDAGELAVYWWAPNGAGWQIANLTSSLPEEQARPEAPLTSTITDEGNLNIFGAATDEDAFVRASWSPGDVLWSIDDLTTIANRG